MLIKLRASETTQMSFCDADVIQQILPAELVVRQKEDFKSRILSNTLSITHVNQYTSTLKLGNSHSCKTSDVNAGDQRNENDRPP